MTDSSYEHYETDHEIGQDNIEVLGMDVHNPVFITSALLIILFVTTTIVFPAAVNAALGDIKSWFLTTFDWFLMASASGMLLFCLVLCVLPVSRIRLGGPEAAPDFSRMSWFSMLFAAGMGIGLMFWGVAEPMVYY
jgi:BCCT family betaine/carnitine transporter